NSAVRIFSGGTTGMSWLSANWRTGEGVVCWPRPAGRSGWVTTPTTGSDPWTSWAKVAEAIPGVPMNTIGHDWDMTDLSAGYLNLLSLGREEENRSVRSRRASHRAPGPCRCAAFSCGD